MNIYKHTFPREWSSLRLQKEVITSKHHRFLNQSPIKSDARSHRDKKREIFLGAVASLQLGTWSRSIFYNHRDGGDRNTQSSSGFRYLPNDCGVFLRSFRYFSLYFQAHTSVSLLQTMMMMIVIINVYVVVIAVVAVHRCIILIFAQLFLLTSKSFSITPLMRSEKEKFFNYIQTMSTGTSNQKR